MLRPSAPGLDEDVIGLVISLLSFPDALAFGRVCRSWNKSFDKLNFIDVVDKLWKGDLPIGMRLCGQPWHQPEAISDEVLLNSVGPWRIDI